MKRSAQAVWRGGGLNGQGSLTTDSQALSDTPYSFSTRFGAASGTNPEELVAAAHSGCFSMALAFMLSEAGFPPEEIRTRAEISIESPDKKGWVVTSSHLVVSARVPGIEPAKFQELARKAETECPISKLLKAKITLEAKLEQGQTQVA